MPGIGRKRELILSGWYSVRVAAQKGEGLAAGLVSFLRNLPGGQQELLLSTAIAHILRRRLWKAPLNGSASRDLVIGPTHDGGYYLVGAKAAYPTLFENDGLGTASALEAISGACPCTELFLAHLQNLFTTSMWPRISSARSRTGTGIPARRRELQRGSSNGASPQANASHGRSARMTLIARVGSEALARAAFCC